MELSHPPWLTLGSVTLLGQAASICGCLFTGILAVAAGMAGAWGIPSALAGGFLGTNFDSLLGATFQERGLLSNNGVDLVATLFGAVV
jgi:uncharacterized membrane protein